MYHDTILSTRHSAVSASSEFFRTIKFLDGKPVKTSVEAANAIRAHQPGDTITLTIVRDGAPPTDVSAVLAKLGAETRDEAARKYRYAQAVK